MKERDLIEQWLSWKKAQEGSGFSQKQMAADAGLSQTYLSNIMTGMRNPGTKTLEKLAGALSLSMAEFYAGPPLGAAPPDVFSPGTGLDRSNAKVSARRRSDTAAVDVIRYEDEEYGPPDQESIESDTTESQPVSEFDYEGEPEKTGLALSDTTPDQLEKLFDSVGIPLAELFSMPTDLKPLKKPEPSKTFSEEEPQKRDRTAERTVNNQIPLLIRPLGGDFSRWLSSSSWEKHAPRISCCSIEGNHVFAVRVSDDSMKPDMYQGDILIVNPDDKFIAIDGGIGIVVQSMRFVVRKIYIHKGDYLLIPSNSAYKMEAAPIEETRIYKIALWIPAGQGNF